MKKLLQIYSILFVANCFSQTPIYKWDFDGNMNNSGSATIGPWVPNGTGAIAYVTDRLGEPNKAINIPNTLGYSIDILGNSVMPSGNAARTLSFWVKFVNDNDTKSYPVVGWGAASPNQAFGFWRTGVQNSYYTIGNDYNVPQTNTQIQATNNGWVHIAMTHTATTLSIFYNGVDAGNYPRTLNTVNQIFKLNRLVNSANGGTGDAIQIDDLRIYNTALNATQVADIYNQTITAVPTITNVSATNIGTSTATINYSVNANNAATTTEIRYAVVPGGALQTQVGPSASGTTNTNLLQNLVGLLPNTTYEYSVWAVNSQGTTFSSALTFTTGSLAAPVISAVNVSNITNVSANINFNVNTNGVATPTSINYGTSPTALTSSTQGSVVNSNAPTSTNIGLTALTPNTTYYYQVVAVNSNFLTVSTINSFTTLATAPAPTPIYHYKFNGNLNEENGGPTLTISPQTILPYSFPNNSALFLEKDNLNRTPFFTATLPNLPQSNAARTVSIRINYESGALATENNVFSWGTSVNDQAYGFSQTASNANNFLWGSNDITFPMPTSFSTWYTLTLVYDGSFISIYRDGSLWQQVARNLNTNGTILSIGATPNINSPRFLHARIDDIQIFNTALTQSQITSLNASLSSSEFNSKTVNFKIYPNPATDILNIESENELKSVEIYSIQGQKVLSSVSKEVTISNLASGIYLVQFTDTENITATQKLIIK
jgi:hypothetical protein